jgi:hypothetical protein
MRHSTRSGGLINIDGTYGHLAQDGHAHAVELLDRYRQPNAPLWTR